MTAFCEYKEKLAKKFLPIRQRLNEVNNPITISCGNYKSFLKRSQKHNHMGYNFSSPKNDVDNLLCLVFEESSFADNADIILPIFERNFIQMAHKIKEEIQEAIDKQDAELKRLATQDAIRFLREK